MSEQAEPELVNAQPGVAGEVRKADETQRKMMVQLINVIGATFAPWRQHMLDSGAAPNSETLLASAVATYAGTIMGELIGMGVLQEAALDNVLDALRKNMADGVKAGKAKVLRIAEKVLADEAAQQGTGTKQ